jgi:predicted small metal-binding protein
MLSNSEEVIGMEELKSISCDPACGFMVRSHSEKEVVEFAKSHVQKAHKMKTTDKELKAMVKSA